MERFEDRDLPSVFPGQLPLPTKTGETFVVENFNNDVTRNQRGFDFFGGNAGTVDQPSGITTLDTPQVSASPPDWSLDVGYNLAGQPTGSFSGVFFSLFGLIDTKVNQTGDGVEPAASTQFPGYFLDTLDVYRGFAPLAGRSVDQLVIDYRVSAGGPVTVKIELKDEAGATVFVRRPWSGAAWQTETIALPGGFTSGDTAGFKWRQVSVLSILVEREVGGVFNPGAGHIQLDNIRLSDVDGTYPDLAAAAEVGGGLRPEYREAFLDLVEARAFQYFTDFASTDPRTGGMIQDRSTFADLMTSGGAGFQLTGYAIGAARGYISRANAAQRTLALLQLLHDGPQGSGRVGTTGHHGFLYHFLGIDGRRKQNFDFVATPENEALNTVELSTIDTALAVMGALTAREYFAGNDPTEQTIRTLATNIYHRVDWPFMLDQGTQQFYLGWKPNEARDDTSGRYGRFLLNDAAGEGKYSSKPVGAQERPATLDYYTDEALLVNLLAVASPTHPVPDNVFYRPIRDSGGGAFVRSFPGALFTYQFASAWLDTDALGPDSPPAGTQPIDYFSNTQAAIAATRAYTIANPNSRATWRNGAGQDLWGLSAAEGPFGRYTAYAAPPAAIGMDGGIITTREAEAGSGDGSLMSRGNASGLQTILLPPGGVRALQPFTLTGNASLIFSLRYSDDAAPDTLEVRVDGNLIGTVTTENTRPASGAPGDGWDRFRTAVLPGLIALSSGAHTVTITNTGTDPLGAELDVTALLRPLEDGTTTVYGAGGAVVHAPNEAIASLWRSYRTGLWHPRFGFADAYNADIAGALIPGPGLDDLNLLGVLRTDGPWAHFDGFAIDNGPMMVLIDNFLHDQFVPNLFMNAVEIKPALQRLFPPPSVRVEVASNAAEPATVGSLRFVRSGDLSQSLTVAYTVGGSATAGVDCAALTGMVVFAAGQAEVLVAVTPIDDAAVEGTETVVVTLTAGAGFTIGGGTATLAIADDDAVPPARLVGTATFAAGPDVGGGLVVKSYNPDATERFTLTAFDSGNGGVRVAEGDFNGDGVADVVVGTGPGLPTRVRVLDGVTRAELFAVDPFEASFTGGVFVAAGDITGDGRADLIISPDQGGGPRVRVFSGDGFVQLADFFGIEDLAFRGGARASTGDVNGDGVADLIVAAGFGGGPRLAVFDGQSVPTGDTLVKLFGDFFVFELTLRNGVYVTAGDLNGDGFADVIAGGGPGGGPRVFALSGKDLLAGTQTQVANFFAGDTARRGGIRVAVKNLDGDARADLVVGAGTGAGSQVTAYLGKDTPVDGTPPERFAFDAFPGFAGGVFVG